MKNILACDSEYATLKCESNEYIEVMNATYGRMFQQICNKENNKIDVLNCADAFAYYRVKRE